MGKQDSLLHHNLIKFGIIILYKILLIYIMSIILNRLLFLITITIFITINPVYTNTIRSDTDTEKDIGSEFLDNEDPDDGELDEDYEEDNDEEEENEEETINDPFEKINRKVFAFNDALNRNILQPLTSHKKSANPSKISKGILNFSHNFFELPRTINYTLQGNIANAANSIGRIMVNTLFGFFGIADVAEKLGMEKKNTNFGDTMKKWGIKPGPFIVLPFLGPTSMRGAMGQLAGIPIDSIAKLPLKNTKPIIRNIVYYGTYISGLLSKRSAYEDMINQVASMSKDKYKTFRNLTMSMEQE